MRLYTQTVLTQVQRETFISDAMLASGTDDAASATSDIVEQSSVTSVHNSPSHQKDVGYDFMMPEGEVSHDFQGSGGGFGSGSVGENGGFVLEDTVPATFSVPSLLDAEEGEPAIDLSDGYFSDESEEGIGLYDFGGLGYTSSDFDMWAFENRGVVDLAIKHSMTESAMNDLMVIKKAPYKCWKTIANNLRKDSGINGCIRDYPICPGHIFFYDESVMTCSICHAERTPTESLGAMRMSWMRLAPRLQDWFENKSKCEQLYDYMSSTEFACGDRVQDFFDAAAY